MSVSEMNPPADRGSDRPDCRLSTALDRAISDIDRAIAAHPTVPAPSPDRGGK